MEKYISIGEIINTHGIKGEVKVRPETDDANRFSELKIIYIDEKPRKVKNVKFQKDKVILEIEGIETMNDANLLRGKNVLVDRKDATKLPEGRYFIVDIEGMDVIDTEGFNYGKVYRVIQTGSNDVYWVKGNKEILIPVMDEYICSTSLEDNKIIIRPYSEWSYED